METKNSRAVYHPERYCPICGSANAVVPGHKCPVSTLSSINSANTRASNNEDTDSEYSLPFSSHEPSLAQRLAVGFGLLEDDEPERSVVL